MILTQCAVCATELGLSLGKKCGRCSTRYCGPECQVQHWKEGGHDNLCKLIKKAGGAEQYNANQKYTAAVAVAAEACAEDTKGQTCYICTQALHWKTKEGLVRGVRAAGRRASRTCRAWRRRRRFWSRRSRRTIWDLRRKMRGGGGGRRAACASNGTTASCGARSVGRLEDVRERPEADQTRCLAMGVLGSGLSAAERHEEALSVQEVELAMARRLSASEDHILGLLGNLASTYTELGRDEEALPLRRDVYSSTMKLEGRRSRNTLLEANNYAAALVHLTALRRSQVAAAQNDARGATRSRRSS